MSVELAQAPLAMMSKTIEASSAPNVRVLVVSMLFEPCREVGGKRFSFLSKYLDAQCSEYHVLARREHTNLPDLTGYKGAVHRVRGFPDWVEGWKSGLLRVLSVVWVRWLCLLDPHVGWLLPATVTGLRICRRHQINVVIVSVPYFSPIVVGTLIARLSGARLIIDYRDPMTCLERSWPKPFGRRLSRAAERAAVRSASAIVFCSEVMKEEFMTVFGAIAPTSLEVIHNGFVDFEQEQELSLGAGRINVIYAGEFYGKRRLSVIAPSLAEMQQAGEISSDNFRLHLYAELRPEDFDLIDGLGIGQLIDVHEWQPYHRIKQIMRAADILFLPSGDDVPYAVPYKFFDYLSVRRPILAIAPVDSSIHRLMKAVDCGEFGRFGDSTAIKAALRTLIRRTRSYTYDGAEQFRWENAACAYMRVITKTLTASAGER